MLFTSVENKKIKNIKKLYTKKYRDINNEFIIEGEHLVLEAYKNGVLKEVLLEENTDIDIDVEKNYVTKNVLKYISNLDNPSNILGVCIKKEKKFNQYTCCCN